MNERSTFTDVDGRRRIVSWWSRGGTAPHRRWIEAQEVDDDTGEWVTRADSGELWAAPGDAKERFLREHVPWFGTRVEKTRGPIEAIEPPEDEWFLVLGTVQPPHAGMARFLTDDDASTWPVGRFGFQHQFGGHTCGQAWIDGAWFPVSSGEEGFASQLRAAYPDVPPGVPIEWLEVDAIDDALGAALRIETGEGRRPTVGGGPPLLPPVTRGRPSDRP